ncbi:MAG TPA: PEP-CTERM sorting domain-containing protein [Kiritimatiellia bacterium]|nr:PEP-CTERM sorting domain-containing protein [Kiritimatiellia bacterium]
MEQFNSGDEGWSGSGFDDSGHDAGQGNGPGALYGTMDAPSMFFPQVGIFHADGGSSLLGGGSAFTGSYPAVSATGINFDFLAQDVLPSGLALVINGAGHTFTYGLSVPLYLDTWTTYSIPLFYSGSWAPLSMSSEFSLALQSIQYVEVRVLSSGTSQQTYYLDNFELSGELDLMPAVPEPASGLLFMGLIAIVIARRQQLQRQMA